MKMFLKIFMLGLLFCFQKQCLWAGILENVMEGKASVIDLTYPLNENNAYWPVGNYTPFKYEVIANIKKDMVFSGRYSTPEHLGTHIDAPNHFEFNQPSVDQIPLSNWSVLPLLSMLQTRWKGILITACHNRTSCYGKR